MGHTPFADNRYLRRRRGKNRSGYRWYVRVTVPEDIRETIGKASIERALHTSDIREARKRRYAVLAEIFTEFEAARNKAGGIPATSTGREDRLAENIRAYLSQNGGSDEAAAPIEIPPVIVPVTASCENVAASDARPGAPLPAHMAAPLAAMAGRNRNWMLTGGIALVAAIGIANLVFMRADNAMGQPQSAPKIAAAVPLKAAALQAQAIDGRSDAELLLARHYLSGKDRQKNAMLGLHWLHLAADDHQPVAAYMLGSIYKQGKIVPADAKKAYHWYATAAEMGNRKAMYMRAIAEALGEGTKKNARSAAHWFAKAAQLGYGDSQYNLAVLYERGDGVPQDLVQAYKWYAIAAQHGDAGSAARLDVLKTQMTHRQIQHAEEAAKRFRADVPDPRSNTLPRAAAANASRTG